MDAQRENITLTPEPYDGPLAAELIAELQQEYVVRYGGMDSTPVDPAEFTAPNGVYFVVRDGDDVVVGSAALRRHDETTVELKRMYVRLAHRRRGIGRHLLAAVEDAARDLGYRQIVLETGSKQPEALALYETAGYRRIESFGHYRDAPSNRCFGRGL